MADTITGLYDFTLPEVGGSDDTWGGKLNANWLKMETLLAGVFPGGTPTALGGRLVLTGTGPVLEFTETDAVSPAGRHRLVSGAGGVGRFSLQKAASDGTYTGATDIWSLLSDGSTLAFGVPVTGSAATFGAIEINVNAGYVRRTTGSLVYDVPTAQIHSFRVNNVDAARVEPAGPTYASALAIITGEKGDARYARIDVGNTYAFTQQISMGTPTLRFLETDAVSPAGQYALVGFQGGDFGLLRYSAANFTTGVNLMVYDAGLNRFNFSPPVDFAAAAHVVGNLTVDAALNSDGLGVSNLFDISIINPTSAAAMIVRVGRSSPTGNISLNVLNPGTTTVRVSLSSAGTGSVAAGVGDFGDYLIGAAAAGTVDTTLISAKTNSPFNIRSGLSTGVLARVQQANATTAASFDPAGAVALSGATAVATREKGDFRWALKTTMLNALQLLSDTATMAELRAALIGALNAPIEA